MNAFHAGDDALILSPGRSSPVRFKSQGGEMPDRILTSHAGSLPRPEDLIALNERRAAGDFTDEAEYLGRLRAAVADVVARQRETGIDLVNDGEYGHSMGMRV
jgi:hypothetical protein